MRSKCMQPLQYMGFSDDVSIFLEENGNEYPNLWPVFPLLQKKRRKIFPEKMPKKRQSLPKVATIALQTSSHSGQAIFTVHEKEAAGC